MDHPSQINVIVEKQVFVLNRRLLTEASDNQTIRLTSDFSLPLPEWVTKQAYLLIAKYLNIKKVDFLKSYTGDSDLIVKLLRTSDYLGMSKFHDQYITSVLIPDISEHNCLILLEESHKKLKNMDNSQSWFNLLNMAITYLSTHIYEIFNSNSQKLKRLNDKIINEVLDRVIKQQRKNNFQNKHMLFQLIAECKESQAGGKAKLCRYLHTTILNKKIHTKIHAKLSWKLEKIVQINDKRTKIFKFLDLRWFLSAIRNNNDVLQINLNIVPPFLETSQSWFSTKSSEKSERSLQIGKQQQILTESNQNNENEYLLKNDSLTKIGVFYSKVIWKVDDNKKQEKTNLHYIIMNDENPISIINFDKDTQVSLSNKKVQLTIFCNMDQVYSFLLNYISLHYDGLKLNGADFIPQQLKILIKISKKEKNYSSALRFTTQLFHCHPQEKRDPELPKSYDPLYMTKIQQDIYANLFGNQVGTYNSFGKPKSIKNLNQISVTTNNQEEKKSFSQNQRRISPINQIYKQNPINVNIPRARSMKKGYKTQVQNRMENSSEIRTQFMQDIPRPTRLNLQEQLDSSLNNSRADSKGSKRKIFNHFRSQENIRKSMMDEMMKVTNLSRYLTKQGKNSDLIKILPC